MTSASDQHLCSDPKRLLLELAREHSLPDLLRMIVARLSETRRVALARIWLTKPTSACSDCPIADACRGQAKCLHLVASDGRSLVTPGITWRGVDGAFARFPFGARKVGRIAATGESMEIPDLAEPLPDWLARPEWILA